MAVKFNKYHGAGNDFIVIDNRGGNFQPDPTRIARMCHRRFGIGADGMMLLESSTGYDFSMRYYNADGRESSMCGNGGRCMVDFARLMEIIDKKTVFEAVDGIHEAKILPDGRISLKMQDVGDISRHQGNDLIDTGSPHYVVHVEDLREIDVVDRGRKIRNDPQISANGMNVDFIFSRGGQHIDIRTYERGVEAETLACGTGAVAAAISAYLRSPAEGTSFILHAQGGDLKVDFKTPDQKVFSDIWLTGPAQKVFEGYYSESETESDPAKRGS